MSTDLLILILNIIGTLFLSIEAIKLENFQKLNTFLKKFNSKLNPEIEWVDDIPKHENQNDVQRFIIFLFIWVFIFFPFFFVSLNAFFHLRYIWTILLSFIGSLLTWPLIILFFELIIKFIKAIESYTPKGIIGIVGFLILLCSFFIQYFISKNLIPKT